MDKEELTALSDFAPENKMSHRETAFRLLEHLKEEMPREDFETDLTWDIQEAIVQSVLEEMRINISGEDWESARFREPADYLNASKVADYIGSTAEFYLKEDQLGVRSADIIAILFDYAEEYDIGGDKDE